MKHTLQQVFHSGKFIVGFSIFMAIAADRDHLSADHQRCSIGDHRSGHFLPTRDLCECFMTALMPPPPIHLIWMMPLPSELPAS